jgi:hypothetical protein
MWPQAKTIDQKTDFRGATNDAVRARERFAGNRQSLSGQVGAADHSHKCIILVRHDSPRIKEHGVMFDAGDHRNGNGILQA